MQEIIIGREYPKKVIELVKNSKKYINILIYDWRWYDGEQGSRIQKFNNEIIRASQRGVKITSIVNNDFVCTALQNCGIDIKRVNSHRTMHIKMIIIDDEYLLLGSHNLTKNAFELNHEISSLSDDQNSITKCNNFFQNLCRL
jgi:phosphatidylserine/phosphatidylglycerophosphate/cardiolipin synthase-like enzyme